MWDKLARHHTPRAKALLGSSYICLIYGLAYTPITPAPERLPAGLDVLSAVPLWIFGGLWLVCSAAGVTVFLLRRVGAAVFAAQFGMYLLWSLSYGLAWAFGDPRGWVTAGVTGGIAVMVVYLAKVAPPIWWPIRLRWPRWSK